MFPSLQKAQAIHKRVPLMSIHRNYRKCNNHRHPVLFGHLFRESGSVQWFRMILPEQARHHHRKDQAEVKQLSEQVYWD
jgi:hypothetical protein